MSDAAELGKDLAALDAKAAGGKWATDEVPKESALQEIHITAPLEQNDGWVTDSWIATANYPHEADLIVALRNNLPAILDALACKAAVDEMQDQSEPPDHKHDAMMRELGRALEGRARHIRETWEQR